MGRLIDADAMANRLRDSLKEHPEWHHMTMGLIDSFIKELEEEPTAYDVEKVVAELENKESITKVVDLEEKQLIRLISLDCAIDIVKAGGVE